MNRSTLRTLWHGLGVLVFVWAASAPALAQSTTFVLEPDVTHGGGTADLTTAFGINPNASIGRDPFDQPEPPPAPSGGVRAYSDRSAWAGTFSEFDQEAQPSFASGESREWPLVVEAPAGSVTVTWTADESAGLSFAFEDGTTGVSRSISDGDTYSFTSTGSIRRLTVTISRAPTRVEVGDGAGYYLLAAPSDDETIGSFFEPVWTQCFPGADYNGGACSGANTGPNVYDYNETAAGDLNVGYTAPSASDALEAGVGVLAYLYADDDFNGTDDPFPKSFVLTGNEPALPFSWGAGGDAPLTFTDTGVSGADNDGDGEPDDGWNLLGNPRRSALDWDAVWENGAVNVDPVAYIYDPTAGYSSYDASMNAGTGAFAGGTVLAGQGFFVLATGASPQLEAPTGSSASRTMTSRRSGSPTPHIEVRISATTDGGSDTGRWVSGGVLVAFTPDGTVGLDGRDAPSRSPLLPPYVWVAALEDGTPVAHAVRPLEVGATEVGLALALSGVQRDAVVTWRRSFPDGWSATLVDLEDGTETPMTEGGSYALALEAGATLTPGRLAVRVDRLGPTSSGEAPTVMAVSQPHPNPSAARSEISLSQPVPGRARVTVYDALGRKVAVPFEGEVTGTAEVALEVGSLSPGVYVIRVESAGVVEVRTLTVAR